MKHIHLLAALAAAAVLVACGGSSSSSSSSPGTTTVNPGTPRIEAVVLNPTTFDDGTQSKGQTFVIQDPSDIESQDVVQFQLVYYDASGNRIVLSATQWSTNDTANLYGSISYNSGVFDASSTQTSTPQVVSVIYNGTIFSANYQVLPAQVRLRGVLENDQTHAPIAGVEIDFYGPQNPGVTGSPEIFRSKVTTAYDGSFRASVPPSATGFTLVNNTLPTSYQRFYRFKGSYFSTGNSDCLAPLATYTNGEYFLINYANSNVATNGTILLVPKTESTPATSCGP